MPAAYLHVPVDEPVELKIIIVLSERVDERLRHLQPTEEEGELNHKGVNVLCLLKKKYIFFSRLEPRFTAKSVVSTLLNSRDVVQNHFWIAKMEFFGT